MNLGKLNAWLQVTGTFGVLAGLVFVGLQLKQAERIALGDGLLTASQRQNHFAEVIGQAAEVWIKGIAGETLSAADQAHFDELAEAWALMHYSSYYRTLQVGNREAQAERWIREAALDLYDHPGLLKYWRSSRKRIEYTLGSNEFTSFDHAVDEAFKEIEERGGIEF